jgi:hypothetical protein
MKKRSINYLQSLCVCFGNILKTGKASFIRRFDFFINKKSKRICVFDKSSKRTFNADSYFQFF